MLHRVAVLRPATGDGEPEREPGSSESAVHWPPLADRDGAGVSVAPPPRASDMAPPPSSCFALVRMGLSCYQLRGTRRGMRLVAGGLPPHSSQDGRPRRFKGTVASARLGKIYYVKSESWVFDLHFSDEHIDGIEGDKWVEFQEVESIYTNQR